MQYAPTLLLAGLFLAGTALAGTSLRLTSSDFANGSPIPVAHEGNSFGCTGRNVPPTLSWTGAPKGTRSFVLTMVDPDAPQPGGFVHWIVYNIPARRHSIDSRSLHGTSQGQNDSGSTGYVGPCPPSGSGPHHYHFTLYALNLRRIQGRDLDLSSLRKAMKHHILAQATLIGTFERSSRGVLHTPAL